MESSGSVINHNDIRSSDVESGSDNDDYYDDADPYDDWDDEQSQKSTSKEDNKSEDVHTIIIPKTKEKIPIKTREQDAIATLLSTTTSGDTRNDDVVYEMSNQGIHLSDLSALTKDDLILLGITNKKEQEELLNTFQTLPKQAPDYDKLTKSQSTEDYNDKILSGSLDRLKLLKSSTKATNLKLNIIKTDDAVINEEEFASNYVLQTIDELKRLVLEMEDRISLLEELLEEKESPKEKKFPDSIFTIIAGVTVISLAYLFWRRN